MYNVQICVCGEINYNGIGFALGLTLTFQDPINSQDILTLGFSDGVLFSGAMRYGQEYIMGGGADPTPHSKWSKIRMSPPPTSYFHPLYLCYLK